MTTTKVFMKENFIFKKFLDGFPVHFGNLHEWLDNNYVYQLNANYEWFALWRIATDMRLIESGRTKISVFVRQMNMWFPEAPHPCKASEINRYKRGYLGNTPFKEWNRYVFCESLEDTKNCKQSSAGFDNLYRLCKKLSEELPKVQLKQTE